MTARVLVVDDILANVKLLEARLTAEYFEVLTANNGASALDIVARERVDVVLRAIAEAEFSVERFVAETLAAYRAVLPAGTV